MTTNRYFCDELVAMAAELLEQGGVPAEPAQLISETLVEGDLMGHTTHGLALLPAYLRELESGTMKSRGRPAVISGNLAAVVWDGDYLNGIYLTRLAVEEALERSREQPVVTYLIRRSHHIGCLAAYMPEIIEAGRIGILMASDPSVALVAPFGGRDPVYSPNPIAAGIPAGPNGPVILDMSTSVTAAGVVHRHNKAGTPLPGQWLLSRDGEPTDDPAAFDNGGSILPLGGLDTGYKGYALGLLVEALTSGLAGFGRAEEPTTWGTSVCLQIINPDAFAGLSALEREMGRVTEACRGSRPRHGGQDVRVPGDRALALKAEQLSRGVVVNSELAETLHERCNKAGVQFPAAIEEGVD